MNNFLKSVVSNFHQIITSELTLAECLIRPIRIDNKELENMYLDYIVNNERITLEKIDMKTLMIAVDIRAKKNFKILDAIHIATAIKNRCSAIFTNDKQFNLLKTENMDIWLLDEVLKNH